MREATISLGFTSFKISEHSLEDKWLWKQEVCRTHHQNWSTGWPRSHFVSSWDWAGQEGSKMTCLSPDQTLIFLLMSGMEFKVLKIWHYLAFNRFPNGWPLKCQSFPLFFHDWAYLWGRLKRNFKSPTFIASKSSRNDSNKSLGFYYWINDQSFYIQLSSCDTKQWSGAPLSLKSSQQFCYKIFWGSL
jgi:hypothetical protein